MVSIGNGMSRWKDGEHHAEDRPPEFGSGKHSVTLPEHSQYGGMLLADELLLLTLSPAEARNTRVHDGIRAAVCGAEVFDLWFAGAPWPGDLKWHIRKNNFGALEPALNRLAAAGHIDTRRLRGIPGVLGGQAETLLDTAQGSAIRDRLRVSLAGPGLPSARDAALAVLLYAGRLWNWSGLEAYSVESVLIFGRRQPATTPLKRQAQALAEGRLAGQSDTVGALAAMAKAVDYEYTHYSD